MSQTYQIDCSCGAKLVMHDKKGKCTHCGVGIEIIWPADGEKIGASTYQVPKTISEKYDDERFRAAIRKQVSNRHSD